MKKNLIMILIGILLLSFFIFGLIGSSISAKIGVTCDFGLGEDGSVFCWKWHKNIVGEFEETINNILDK